MKNTNQPNLYISEPTAAEISKAREKVMSKYDVVLSDDDAAKMAKLFKELEWWFSMERFSRDPKSISIEAADEIRGYLKKKTGKDLAINEAHLYANLSMQKIASARSDEIGKSIKHIIDKY